MGLSIRWRLTLWITLALAGVLVGYSALVYAMLAHALYERVDQSLLSVFQEIESKPNPDLSYWIKEAKEHQNILCVVYDPQGNVYERTEELSSQSVPPKPDRNGPGQRYADLRLPILGHATGPYRRQRATSRRNISRSCRSSSPRCPDNSSRQHGYCSPT